MKSKIALTKEQIDKLVATEEKQLRAKLEIDLSKVRKKYEVVEVDIKGPVKQTKKSKLTDELFKQYCSQGLNVREIAELSGYNEGYIYKIKKRILSEK